MLFLSVFSYALYRDAENQTIPIKLEQLQARQELQVDKILNDCLLQDELTVIQFPNNLPAFVYPESAEMNEEEEEDIESQQANCDNYPQGRFGTIKVYGVKAYLRFCVVKMMTPLL